MPVALFVSLLAVKSVFVGRIAYRIVSQRRNA